MNRKEQIAKEVSKIAGVRPDWGMVECFRIGFSEGAKWADKNPTSPWIRTEDKMPEDNQLVLTSSGIYGTKLLEWNSSHALWFHEGGEDAYCERDKIDAWMPIPE